MKQETLLQFYQLYEQLASLTQIVNQTPDIPRIESILNRISAMFRLSKGVTHFYRTPGDEQRGEGESMCSYDTGIEGKPVHMVRFVTRLLSITTMTVYMAEDAEPLTEEELAKVDLTMRTALAFISRNRLQKIAEEVAFFDEMGFPNLRGFFNYLVWNPPTSQDKELVAFCYDLRHFSLVNEEYGRMTGDIVLRGHYQEVTRRIGASGMVARLGKDEFLGICERSVLPDLIDCWTETAIRIDQAGNTISMSAYAGLFELPKGFVMDNPGDIMHRIMSAKNAARNGAPGNIAFYSDEINADREHAKRIQRLFPEALRQEEFRVFYQPKVNTMTGRLCGAEALCRWFRDGKIVPPMQFIPLLEESGDICRLDLYMVEHVCADIRRWLDEGKPVVRISVNLSRKHIMNADLVDTLIGIIDRHQVPHSYIEIELTETTTDVEFKDLKRVVDGLHEQGIATSVDDFGMGYSSLNLIRVVPWNVLKVDKIFLPMDGEPRDSTRSVMFKYVIAMAKELGLECIVEGVETPAQLELLRENACELAQGYLFDKPLPVEEFEQRLEMDHYPQAM